MPNIMDFDSAAAWQAAWNAWNEAQAAEREARIHAARSNAAKRGAVTRRHAAPPTAPANCHACDWGTCEQMASAWVNNRGRERRPMCDRHAVLACQIDSGNKIETEY